MLRRLAVLVLATSTVACGHAAASGPGAANDLLFAVAWVQTAAEYEAAALATYQSAVPALERALADTSWTAVLEQQGEFAALPPAIIVDVDETVLDNSAYQARLIAGGGEFSRESWGAWVDERKATAVPGALEFLSAAAGRGVRVFYVSNRDVGQVEATRDNLAKLGFPDTAAADTLYFQDPSRGWKDKSSRRAAVAKTHRVVLVFGDNLFDFVERDQPDLAERAAMVRDNGGWWGSRWFMLPNPMYGSWDDALIAYDRKQSAVDKHRKRASALDVAQ